MAVGTATTLDEARHSVRTLGQKEPGEYLIVSLQTGHKETLKVDKAGTGTA